MDISRSEIRNEASKYRTYKVKVESIIDQLNAMKNQTAGTFQGKIKDEMIESINLLQNRCRDLSEDLQRFSISLDDLQEEVFYEEKRQERIRREIEGERKRKEQ